MRAARHEGSGVRQRQLTQKALVPVVPAAEHLVVVEHAAARNAPTAELLLPGGGRLASEHRAERLA